MTRTKLRNNILTVEQKKIEKNTPSKETFVYHYWEKQGEIILIVLTRRTFLIRANFKKSLKPMLVNESMTNGKITSVKNEKKNSNDNEISEVLNNFFSRVST